MADDDRWIIAGLGNPGPEYAGNRHNAGHMVVDLLAERMGSRFKAHRTRNEVADGRLAGIPVTLAKPRTYMNTSGGPVAALAAFYKVPPERVVVVHDELDIPFGTIRLKLLKIGAVILRNTRRIRVFFSTAYPYQALFRQVCATLGRT